MPEAIGPLSRPPGLGPLTPVGPKARPETGTGFDDSLSDVVAEVNRVQHEASAAVEGLATGDGANLHEVMLAVNKAELSFTFLMEARNKLVEAYQEVMRMPV
ncbi:MAG: flagellar hook-basal body complex protein FliE [Planctomycetota bacterium]